MNSDVDIKKEIDKTITGDEKDYSPNDDAENKESFDAEQKQEENKKKAQNWKHKNKPKY